MSVRIRELVCSARRAGMLDRYMENQGSILRGSCYPGNWEVTTNSWWSWYCRWSVRVEMVFVDWECLQAVHVTSINHILWLAPLSACWMVWSCLFPLGYILCLEMSALIVIYILRSGHWFAYLLSSLLSCELITHLFEKDWDLSRQKNSLTGWGEKDTLADDPFQRMKLNLAFIVTQGSSFLEEYFITNVRIIFLPKRSQAQVKN